jgi:ribonuclease E
VKGTGIGMAKRMLIDATQAEETRVAVIDGNRLDELDFEVASRQQLKGNIYLAKVTRVEPSLQAAFVEYGGNRHGFLAFAEIHPDYYRIPIADREKLLELERELQLQEEREEAEAEARAAAKAAARADRAAAHNSTAKSTEADADLTIMDGLVSAEADGPLAFDPTSTIDALAQIQQQSASPAEVATLPPETLPATSANDVGFSAPLEAAPSAQAELMAATESVSQIPQSEAGQNPLTVVDDVAAASSASALEGEILPPSEIDGDVEADDDQESDQDGDDEAHQRRSTRRRMAILRQYKIQEVIKRNQIILIQVVKEERGNKGAALTTYLSLAGRYCVLMPNTNRGGGVSRKISSIDERKRMKALLAELDLPQGMSIILRTAGLERSKADIKRDLEYLTRLWDSIREKTLSSTAPSLIHEEANLIRRAIRDLYSKEVSEIQVEGDTGYRTAKDFMRMMVPSAARRVHHYRDPAVPLFVRHRVESQIETLYSPTVNLKSGGYIVINQTEALVAIDVNSGRSTKERNIEETALRTNLEAAEEVARQLRLRDLAGLIVIDFIDMEDSRHNAQVERKIREAMKNDRARIQLGRISCLVCWSCRVSACARRSLKPISAPAPIVVAPAICAAPKSAALHVLRAVEEEGLQQKASELAATVSDDVALYLLNTSARH